MIVLAHAYFRADHLNGLTASQVRDRVAANVGTKGTKKSATRSRAAVTAADELDAAETFDEIIAALEKIANRDDLPPETREKARAGLEALSKNPARSVSVAAQRAVTRLDNRETMRARMGKPSLRAKITREGNQGVFRTMTRNEARDYLARKGT